MNCCHHCGQEIRDGIWDSCLMCHHLKAAAFYAKEQKRGLVAEAIQKQLDAIARPKPDPKQQGPK